MTEKYLSFSARDLKPVYTSGATNQTPYQWSLVNANTATVDSNTTSIAYASANGIFAVYNPIASIVLPKGIPSVTVNVWVYMKSYITVGAKFRINGGTWSNGGTDANASFKWVKIGTSSIKSEDLFELTADAGAGATIIKSVYFNTNDKVPTHIPTGAESMVVSLNEPNKLIVKNNTTSKVYSLDNKTLTHLPSSSSKNMILHGIESGKEIKLNEEFNKMKYVKDTSEILGSGKKFTNTVDMSKTKINKIIL